VDLISIAEGSIRLGSRTPTIAEIPPKRRAIRKVINLILDRSRETLLSCGDRVGGWFIRCGITFATDRHFVFAFHKLIAFIQP
jgi:hypothetical protein